MPRYQLIEVIGGGLSALFDCGNVHVITRKKSWVSMIYAKDSILEVYLKISQISWDFVGKTKLQLCHAFLTRLRAKTKKSFWREFFCGFCWLKLHKASWNLISPLPSEATKNGLEHNFKNIIKLTASIIRGVMHI